ncbi:TetR/AcrR family transcriptional regulator [Bradyrhizobium sp. SYSU BS000235]|uniref:TetR/AcrR family transcriptional regulator n=1 Tax=Bradyrhizobium sp. SYSU BS000235 TaxID=3411332 RepID=UPI003C72E78F
MSEQLSATDWLDAGLKALAASGVVALKADPLAKALGVSRGSFYWHFRDVEAFQTAVLARWRDIATERIIANVEKHADAAQGVEYLLRGAFAARSDLEVAVRSWATHDAAARKTVREIDQRRMTYIEALLERAGIAAETARARAKILYWAFLGFELSDKPLPGKERDRLIEELVRVGGTHG